MDPRQPPSLLVLSLPKGGESAILMKDRTDNLVLDTGTEDDASSIVRPALDWLGINQPGAIVLSHADLRHIGGTRLLAEPFERLPVHPPLFPGPSPSDSELRSWLEERRQAAPSLSAPKRGEVGNDVRYTVLHPPRDNPLGQADDNALVLLMEAGPWRILWLGDAGRTTEDRLVREHQAGNIDLRAHVVVRDHHRTDGTDGTRLYALAEPLLLIQPQDPTDKERRTRPFTLSWLEKTGIRLVNPAKTGATLLDFHNGYLLVREWLGATYAFPRTDAPASP
jgi:competence protein ComEC